jgi:hypothetical protein
MSRVIVQRDAFGAPISLVHEINFEALGWDDWSDTIELLHPGDLKRQRQLHVLLFGCDPGQQRAAPPLPCKESIMRFCCWLYNPSGWVGSMMSLFDMWVTAFHLSHHLTQKFHKSLYLKNALIVLVHHFMDCEQANDKVRVCVQILYSWFGGNVETHTMVVAEDLLDRIRERLLVLMEPKNRALLKDPPSNGIEMMLVHCADVMYVRYNAASKAFLRHLALQHHQRVQEVRAQEAAKKADELAKQARELAKLHAAERSKHSGLPLPHPEHGRPRLQHGRCLFAGCGADFESAYMLYVHLTSWMPHYRENFHKSHHDYAIRNNFSPEYVREHNVTRCPALACEGRHFDTPAELIYHFEELGIERFWSIGWNPRDAIVAEPQQPAPAAAAEEHKEGGEGGGRGAAPAAASVAASAVASPAGSDACSSSSSQPPIKASSDDAAEPASKANAKMQVNVKHHTLLPEEGHEDCSICLVTPANALFLPCTHQIACLACVQQLREARCPICNVESSDNIILPQLF